MQILVRIFQSFQPSAQNRQIRKLCSMKKQGIDHIDNVFLEYGSSHLLLSVLVLLIIYFQAFHVNQMNRDLLISMTGLLFSVFLGFVPAMPGWYMWVVPFFMLYLAGLMVQCRS